MRLSPHTRNEITACIIVGLIFAAIYIVANFIDKNPY
jgi:hypothetical protein